MAQTRHRSGLLPGDRAAVAYPDSGRYRRLPAAQSPGPGGPAPAARAAPFHEGAVRLGGVPADCHSLPLAAAFVRRRQVRLLAAVELRAGRCDGFFHGPAASGHLCRPVDSTGRFRNGCVGHCQGHHAGGPRRRLALDHGGNAVAGRRPADGAGHHRRVSGPAVRGGEAAHALPGRCVVAGRGRCRAGGDVRGSVPPRRRSGTRCQGSRTGARSRANTGRSRGGRRSCPGYRRRRRQTASPGSRHPGRTTSA